MKQFFDVVGAVSRTFAALAKIVLGLMVVVVVADVTIRNLGMRPISWAVSASEYALLFAAFLPMPWLVHTKGHVFVEFLRKALPSTTRAVLEKAVYVVCVGICLYLGTYALMSFLEALANGDYETRTFDMPKWLVFLPIVLGFYLSALEWLRYLLGFDSLYDLDPLEVEGL
jgi:TRAP-type C4-dicarboxylate transport system permease small subunit